MGKQRNGKAEASLPLLAARKQRPEDRQLEEACPTLHACLMPVWNENKCRRQSGSVRIRIVGGFYQVTLSCPTEGLETTLIVGTLVGVVEALESRLNDPGCVWMPDFETQKKSRHVRIDDVQ